MATTSSPPSPLSLVERYALHTLHELLTGNLKQDQLAAHIQSMKTLVQKGQNFSADWRGEMLDVKSFHKALCVADLAARAEDITPMSEEELAFAAMNALDVIERDERGLLGISPVDSFLTVEEDFDEEEFEPVDMPHGLPIVQDNKVEAEGM